MFERFTERSRQVVVHAQEAARENGHGYIGTEHLLVGLTFETDALAAEALAYFGLDHDEALASLLKIVPVTGAVITGQIPFTPRCKKVLELALREALSIGCNYIGTEHLLLGLVRENEGVAARILLEHDIDSEKARNEVMRRFNASAVGKSIPPKAVAKVVPVMTRLVTKTGQAFTLVSDPDAVMGAIREAGDGLIGFRCIDEQMRYVAKDQIAVVEPDSTEVRDAA